MMLKIRKFGTLTFREQLCFSEALFLQLAVGLLLKVVPFRKIPGLFAGQRGMTEASGIGSEAAGHTLEQVREATRRAGRISPWKNKCLVQSLAARRMLNSRRIGSKLSLGLAKNENNKLMAHAWLKSGEFEIVARNGDFQELYLF
jgi:hypothetical protein